MSFCNGCIFQDVFFAIGHELVQLHLASIHALQDRSCSEEFKRAAHRKTFFRSVIEAFAAASVHCSHTDSSAGSLLDRQNPSREIAGRSRRTRSEQQK